MIKKFLLVILLVVVLFFVYLLYVNSNENEAVAIPSTQFPISAFEEAHDPLLRNYKTLKNKLIIKQPKAYKSVVPLYENGREIEAGDLDWHFYNFNGEEDISGNGVEGIAKDAKIPSNFPLEAAKVTVSYFDYLKTGCYALYDLNANGVDEIIVQSGYGSSGSQYLFLEKQRGKWKVINGFAGGFILTSLDLRIDTKEQYSNKYWYITHWWSSGSDFVQIIDAYRDGEYKEVSSQNVPYAVRNLDFGKLNNNASCE
ncbi:hypothetical protein MCEMSEM29_01937 [Methylophilaceae bacterium]